jgi:L-rhamnose isomerase
MANTQSTDTAYQIARDRYAELGVDTEKALETMAAIPVSLQCWQGDDVAGFETHGEAVSSGGIQATGNFPGRARTLDELRADLQQAFSLIPGRHRLNLHAMYGDFGGRPVDRDAILPDHFRSWSAWAGLHHLKLDFNSTCFAHPRAESGYTLSDRDPDIRRFWIEHVRRCRSISAFLGRSQGSACMHDLWIPDGSKDATVSRFEHRALLKSSLDEIYASPFDAKEMKDAVESKLFGIGSESYVVGSHEFYLSYALTRGLIPCIDMGHFHPTESVADKISALLLFCPEVLLHVSRGVRWDSDHVVILNDDLRALAEEILRSGQLTRVHFALDYFDASINRIGAWVIGARATQKSLLLALLEPTGRIREYEQAGNDFARLALLEELKTLPAGAVWDHFCVAMGVPPSDRWMDAVIRYERDTLRKRI